MPESSFKDRCVKEMRERGWCPVKHADAFTPGIADLSYRCAGANRWAELKTIAKWPKRADGIVRLEHELSAEQALFLRERRGTLWIRAMCLGEPRQYFVLDADKAWLWYRIGGWPKAELITQSCLVFVRQFDWERFEQWLSTSDR